MIERTSAFKTSDGTTHENLGDAQAHEIVALLAESAPQITPADAAIVAGAIMGRNEKVIDILTTKPNSKVRARKVNGGTKKRTPKTNNLTLTPTK